MDKIVQLLDKLKSVRDVVAAVDPVHVGLPWARVRAIREAYVLHDTNSAFYPQADRLNRLLFQRVHNEPY